MHVRAVWTNQKSSHRHVRNYTPEASVCFTYLAAIFHFSSSSIADESSGFLLSELRKKVPHRKTWEKCLEPIAISKSIPDEVLSSLRDHQLIHPRLMDPTDFKVE